MGLESGKKPTMLKEELRLIRDNIQDPYQLFDDLGLSHDRSQGNNPESLAYFLPGRKQATASLKISLAPKYTNGSLLVWYDHSSRTHNSRSSGGGPIELIQYVKNFNCYEAGWWLLDQKCCLLNQLPRFAQKNATPQADSQATLDLEVAVKNQVMEAADSPTETAQRPTRTKVHQAKYETYSAQALADLLTMPPEEQASPETKADIVDNLTPEHYQAFIQAQRLAEGLEPPLEPKAEDSLSEEDFRALEVRKKKAQAWLVDPPNPRTTKRLRYAFQADSEHLRGISVDTANYLHCGYIPASEESPGGKSFMKGRVTFEIHTLRYGENGTLEKILTTHQGGKPAGSTLKGPKWQFYKGFRAKYELYNLDNLLLDPEAVEQVRAQGRVILVEGCFDVARLVDGQTDSQDERKNVTILNALATFGSHLTLEQATRLEWALERLEVSQVLVWFDRGDSGPENQLKAVELLQSMGITASGFNWDLTFISKDGSHSIGEDITDPAQMNAKQIGFLRRKGLI